MVEYLPKLYLGVEWLGDLLVENLKVKPSSGAVVTFTGVVRSSPEDGEVECIFYEAYHEMAIKEMESIRRETIERFNIEDLYIYHRTGKVMKGEPAFMVVAVGRHRKETFSACMYAVDRFKERVPIWKKEIFRNGRERWKSNT